MRILVTPRAGLSVRDPVNPALGHLPPEGAVKLDCTAWRRLEAAGDVSIKAAPEQDAPASTPAKKG